MAPIPEPTVTVAKLIDAYYEQQQENPRPHLGCSEIGHPCDRKLWLSFRWVVKQEHPGRIKRLFKRGQDEESKVVRDLRNIGCEVEKTGANQSKVSFGAHVSGSVDGVVSKLPTAPKRKAVLEIKTHSKKSFDELERKGVKETHINHWVQMQTYMLGLKLERALYVSVCKDDDRIYTEWLHLDKDAAEKAVDRAKRIALSERMPEPISTDPSWYQCKLCPFHDFCHVSKMTKQVNCRTCAFSTPKEDSTWRCERHNADGIPYEFQLQGCESHVIHPDLVPWPLCTEHSTETMATYLIDDTYLQNGEPDANVYSSKEIVANLDGCLSGFVGLVRAEFGMEITG